MFTLCPHCHTVSRLQATDLNAAQGTLTCSRCGEAFQAVGRLYDDVLEAQAARWAAHQGRAPEAASAAPRPSTVERAGEVVVSDRTSAAPEEGPARKEPPKEEPPDNKPPKQEPPKEGPPKEEPPKEEPPKEEPPKKEPPKKEPPGPGAALRAGKLSRDWDSFGQPAPEGLRVPKRPRGEARSLMELELLAELEQSDRRLSWKTVAGLAVCSLLLLALGAQYVYFHRAQWVTDPQWRPPLEHFCKVLGCSLPMRREVAGLELLERDVRDHPHVKGAVLINATFVNRSNFTQPYPVFEVAFSDLSGNPVAVRRFAPREYINEPESLLTGMAPDRPARVQLEVMDPGERAVSFQLEFF